MYNYRTISSVCEKYIVPFRVQNTKSLIRMHCGPWTGQHMQKITFCFVFFTQNVNVYCPKDMESVVPECCSRLFSDHFNSWGNFRSGPSIRFIGYCFFTEFSFWNYRWWAHLNKLGLYRLTEQVKTKLHM